MDDDLEVAVPDKCWIEERRNDGRKWIFNYGKKLSVLYPVTTTKEHYINPGKLKLKVQEGKRKQLFKEQVLKEIIQELEKEKSVPDPVEEYCTTYDNQFQIPGFQVNDDMEKDEELSIKHPLYHSTAYTVWHQKIQNRNRGFSKIDGITKISNLKKPFTKNDSFSKPITDRFDDWEC